MKDILTTPLNRPDPHPFYKHKTRSCTPTHMQIQLIIRCFMYNLKMANIDGLNMQLYCSNSKRTIRNIVVYLTIHICTNNLFLSVSLLCRWSAKISRNIGNKLPDFTASDSERQCSLTQSAIENIWTKGRNGNLRMGILFIEEVNNYKYFFSLCAIAPQWALASSSSFIRILVVYRSHITTHHSPQDFSGRVISSPQRPLPNNTQHSQQTNVHAPGGIRNQDLSRRAAADPGLRPRGHWDRHNYKYFFFLLALQPHWGLYFIALQWALASSLARFLDHTQRRATVGRTPLNE